VAFELLYGHNRGQTHVPNQPLSLFAINSRYCCSFMSHLCRTENTVVKTTISTAATTITSIIEEVLRIIISARLYQPEKKLIKIASTSTDDNGRPTERWFRTRFFRSRLASQYSINLISCSVSMRKFKTYPGLHHRPGKPSLIINRDKPCTC
jgi:hypothetical protein